MAQPPTIVGDHLIVERCPWCYYGRPACPIIHHHEITVSVGRMLLKLFHCSLCGGPIVTQHNWKQSGGWFAYFDRITPSPESLGEGLPPKVEHFLNNARETFHAASASIMASASAVDAMLKARGYGKGKLYPRIEKAAKEGLLTEDMKEWAHEVRLDANEERHADEDAPLPTLEDAQKTFEFAETLAVLLFVLPARVRRGREKAGQADPKP